MSITCNGGKEEVEEEEGTFLAGESPFSGSGPLYLGKQKNGCILTVLVCESMMLLLCIFGE